MACPISIGKIDKKHFIFPIIAIILLIIQNYFVYFSDKFDNIGHFVFIRLMYKSFGKSIALIIFLLFRKRIRYAYKKKVLAENNNNYNKEYFENFLEKTEKLKKRKYCIIFFNMFLSFGFDILVCFFSKIKYERYFSFWIFDIFYIWIFSYFILHTKLYRHQYLSIIIITILGIAINIINELDKPFEIKINNLLITLSADILFSLNLVINKYLMDNLLFSEYEITFYEGIFSTIICIICAAIFTKIDINRGNVLYNKKKYIDNYYAYYDSLNREEIIILISIIISQLIIYLFGLLTIKYYTVFHIFIILIANEGEFYRYKSKNDKGEKNKKTKIINIVLYFLFFFMILVFTENIELNCFGLQKYTKRNIIKRAKKDYLKNNVEKVNSINDKSDTTFENSNEKSNNENSNEKSKGVVEIDRFKFDPACDIIEE